MNDGPYSTLYSILFLKVVRVNYTLYWYIYELIYTTYKLLKWFTFPLIINTLDTRLQNTAISIYNETMRYIVVKRREIHYGGLGAIHKGRPQNLADF